MKSLECTEEQFLKDVKDHKLTIKNDSGVYRHLRLGRENSSTYYYNITTWPGYLCISGDMGCYVFARLDDMFNFFKMDKSDFNFNNTSELQINCGYWHEKLVSDSLYSPSKKYSHEKFKELMWEHFEDNYDGEHKEETREEIENMINMCDENEYSVHEVVNDFTSADGFTFRDFWEFPLRVYSYHFIWCLYAIVYGIKLYEKEKDIIHGTN